MIIKKYALIDCKNGDMFEDIFETEQDALKAADNQWSHLTARERKEREMFEVMYGEIDEDGCFDLNTSTTIKSYKQ